MTDLLSSADLTSIRQTVLDSLQSSCTVTRATTSSDGAGGTSKTWSSVAGISKCRVSPLTQSARLIAERLSVVDGMMITFPYDAGVMIDDRVTVGSVVYNIVGFENEAGTFMTAKRTVCSRQR